MKTKTPEATTKEEAILRALGPSYSQLTPEGEVKSPKDLVEDIIKKKAESEDKRYKELEKIVR